ncbi:hypothetical protein CR513_37903, partial [Mucuna pruriens]
MVEDKAIILGPNELLNLVGPSRLDDSTHFIPLSRSKEEPEEVKVNEECLGHTEPTSQNRLCGRPQSRIDSCPELDSSQLQKADSAKSKIQARHKKLSHIEGSGPPRDDPKFEAWDDEDSLTMA